MKILKDINFIELFESSNEILIILIIFFMSNLL